MKTNTQATMRMLIAGFLASVLTSHTLAQAASQDDLEALNAAVGKAIDAHDVNGIEGFLASDAVMDFVPAPPPLTGVNAIGGFFTGLFQGFPDYATTSEQRWVSSNIVVTAHTTSGTLQNAWMGLPATGKGARHMHLDIWQYQAEKIQRITTYADIQSLMISVGLMPAPELPTLQPITGIPTPVPTGLAPLAAVIESEARWNAHDLAGLARMMRADAQVLVAMLGAPLDRSAFVAFSEIYFLAFSNLRSDAVRHLDLGDGWVLSEVVHQGINDGPFWGQPATGRTATVRGAILYEVDGQGLLSSMTMYSDSVSMLAQLGLFPPPPSKDQLTALNASVAKAIDAHDVNGIVSYLAPDAVFDFVPAPPPLTGTTIAGFFAGLFHGYPDYVTISEQRWVSGNAVVTAHSTTGTLQNPWMGLPPTGKDKEVPPSVHMDVWEYQGDKIQRITTYIDIQSLMIDLGLMPAPQLPPLQPATAIPDPAPPNLRPVSAVIELTARWNAHDLVGVAKMMRNDAQVMMAALNGATLDRKSFIALSELYFMGFKDLKFDVARQFDLGGGWVLSEGAYRGTQDGPYFGLPATGRAINVRAALLRQVDSQGLLTAMKVYFDNLTVLTQLGYFPPPSSPPGDFNSDSHPDLLLEDTDGLVGYRSMNSTSLAVAGFFDPNSVGDPAWKVISYGDFDADGKPDVVFQHADGRLAVWLMSGTSLHISQAFDPANAGPGWQLVSVRDVDGDGKPDLIFQHTDGWLGAWLMDGIKMRAATYLDPDKPSDAQWRAIGTGNFNGDGQWALVFQHDDGTLAFWSMDGMKLATTCLLSPSNPGNPDWRVAGIADLDQDGKSDLLFEHRGDQSLAVWFMDGCTLSRAALLDPQYPGGTWKIVGPR